MTKAWGVRITPFFLTGLLFSGNPLLAQSLALSSGSANAGAAISLNLNLASPAGGEPAALQWTFSYPSASITSFNVAAGPVATAAGKSIACAGAAAAYTCVASGADAQTISDGVAATVSLTLANNAAAATVSVNNVLGSDPGGAAVAVTATSGAATTLNPLTVASLNCGLSTLTPQTSTTCTVTLSAASPAGGVAVALSDTSTALATPASVIVPANASSATFTASAGALTLTQTATVTAALNGTAQSAALSLLAPMGVSSLQCALTTLVANANTSCTVTISNSAPAGGAVVALSDNAAALTTPASVTIPANATSTTFTVSTGALAATQTAALTASYSGIAQSANLTLFVPITVTALQCAATTLAPNANTTCTVTLSSAAPAGGTAVALSDTAAALTTPASVTVPANATSATFTASTGSLTSAQTATLTASLSGASQSVTLSLIVPTTVSAVQCVLTTLASNANTTCTLTLTAAAPAGGSAVTLKSSNAALTAPASVTVPANGTSANFTISTKNLTADQNATLSASLNGSTTPATIGLSATVALSSMKCQSLSIVMNSVVTCTVNLKQPIPSGSLVSITAVSDNAALTVPAPTLVVPGKSSSVTLVALSGTYVGNQTANLTVSLYGGSLNTKISLTGGLAGATLSSLTCSPSSVAAGVGGNCALSYGLTLTATTATLTSNNAGLAIPASVSIPALSTTVTFAFTTTKTFAGSAVITATSGTSTKSFTVKASTGLQPAIVSCAASTVTAGGSATCSVALMEPAPAGGSEVALQSASRSLRVPAAVRVAEGQTSATFRVGASSSAGDEEATLRATVGADSSTTPLSVRALKAASLSCSPKYVEAGQSSMCEVRLNAAEIPDAVEVAVSVSSASVRTPAAVATRAGQSSIRFKAVADGAAKQETAVVEARVGSQTVRESLVVMPAGAPALVVPGDASAMPGSAVRFTVSASDGQNLPVTLSAAGLPEGAAFNAAAGGAGATGAASDAATGSAGAAGGANNAAAAGAASGSFKWLPAQKSEGDYPVVFTAQNSLGVRASKTVTVHIGSGQPVVTDVRNAASASTSAACSAGSVATIAGRFLFAGATPVAERTGAATDLSGTRVLVNGSYVPVLYASANRVDMLCPSVAAGTDLAISVETAVGRSNSLGTTMQETAPGIFTADDSADGQAVATVAGSGALAAVPSFRWAGQPALPGDTLSISATGVACNAGGTLLLKLGAQYAPVLSVQPAEGRAGVCQIAAAVPLGISGDGIPVMLEIPSGASTVSSNTAYIDVGKR